MGYGDADWHKMHNDYLLKHLKTKLAGLTAEEAAIRLERDGLN